MPNERYRLVWDGIMNWNKLGWLADKFARHGAAVVAGRYTHNAFWQEPQLIDRTTRSSASRSTTSRARPTTC